MNFLIQYIAYEYANYVERTPYDVKAAQKKTHKQPNNIEMEKPAKINQRHIVLYHRVWIVEAVYEFSSQIYCLSWRKMSTENAK